MGCVEHEVSTLPLREMPDRGHLGRRSLLCSPVSRAEGFVYLRQHGNNYWGKVCDAEQGW